MKKSKALLCFLISLGVVAGVGAISGCSSCNGETLPEYQTEDDDVSVLSTFTINTTSVKKSYEIGETFSSSGLTASARFRDKNGDYTGSATDVSDQVTVDAGNFKNSKAGIYEIVVSYTSGGVTRYASYNVTVNSPLAEFGGLDVSLETNTYTIASGEDKATVDYSDLVVKKVTLDAEGEKSEETLTSDNYSVACYNGTTLVESYETLGKGTYNLVISSDSGKYVGFTQIYVKDPVASIELKETESTVKTQGQSLKDTMSSSWVFETTNASGTKETHNSSEMTITGLNTIIDGTRSATVSYTEVDGLGNETKKTTTVSYTITKDDNIVQQTYAYNFSNFTDTIDKENAMTIGDEAMGVTMNATGSSKFAIATTSTEKTTYYTYTDSDNVTRQFTQHLNSGGKANDSVTYSYFTLKINGPTRVTVYVSSNGSSGRNWVLRDSDKTIIEKKECTSLSVQKEEFIIEEKGTYYLNPDANVNIYYIQIDTFITKTETNPNPEKVELPEGTNNYSVILDTTNASKWVAKGTSADNLATALKASDISLKVSSVNSVTAIASEVENPSASDLTFTLDTSKLAEAAEVTVKYKGADTTAKFKVAVTMGGTTYSDVYDVTAANSTTYEIVSSDTTSKATVSKSDFVVKPVHADGSNATALADANYTIKLKDSTGDPQSSYELTELGDYVFVVTVTLTDGDLSETFTKEVTITVSEKAEAGDEVTESFIVAKAGNAAGASSETFAAGANIDDNTLFTLTSVVATKYSVGSEYGKISTGTNALTYTDKNGDTQAPDQGIKLSNAIAAGATVDSIFTITAKEDITLYVYLVYANDGFTSDKTGDIFYSVGSGTKETVSCSKRKEGKTITVTLKKGEVLNIGATNTHATDSGKLWLFGTEATGVVSSSSSSSESFVVAKAGNAAGASSETFAAGANIDDNTLFTLTSVVATKYSVGSEYGKISTGTNALTYTDKNGDTQAPDQGIKLSNAIAAGATVDSIFTITAKEDITLYVYLVYANDGFTSDKTGDISYSVGSGTKETVSCSKRKEGKTITVTLKKGDVLNIGATNTHATDSGKLWLFGVEAEQA